MKIRKAGLNDAEQIAKNNILLAEESEQQNLLFETVFQGVKTLLSDESKGFYLVAEHDTEIIGQLMITFEWSDWRNQMIWWVQSVYIQRKHRNKGVFTHLLQELKKQAEQQQIHLLRLYVYDTNSQAIDAYKKMGWQLKPYIIFQKEISRI